MKVFSNLTIAALFPLLFVTACSSIPESTLQVSDPQLKCLAEAIHGEARGEPKAGKIFVGRVVITRLAQRFAPTICGVVYAKNQFAPRRDFGRDALDGALEAMKRGANGVTHFHSYATKKTSAASFSTSSHCTFKVKVGAHWGYLCSDGRAPASRAR